MHRTVLLPSSPFPLMRRTKVFFVCAGLGHIARGHETITREVFEALCGDDRLDGDSFKGAGPMGDRERAVCCLRRNRIYPHD